jgi:hypothetical protein
MIEFDYRNGQIKITTQDLSRLFLDDQLPLRFDIKKVVSKEVVWTTNLGSYMWASYPENEINDVVVYDTKGNFVTQHYWDVFRHGSIFYKSLWLYCKGLINNGKRPNGLVIGTHDGEFGEWVPLVRNHMSDMILIEGSEKQYNKLVQNYNGNSEVECLFDLITTNGENVEFFEGGKGYTNSVVERVIRGWEKEEIKSTTRKSTPLNDLLYNRFYLLNKKLDWLHLDVEGLDAKLLMSLKDDFIPNFIIFEDFNLTQEEKDAILRWGTEKGFQHHSEAGIAMFTRK